MKNYVRTHLSDAALVHDLRTHISQECATIATVLADIAEVDLRELYRPAGYASMWAYCVDELRLSEESALRRIQAARAARRFPVLFKALAERQLHLTAVCLLAPHLTEQTADELIEAAKHKRKSEIEKMLARRFPCIELQSKVRSITPMISSLVGGPANAGLVITPDEHSLANVGTVATHEEHSLANVEEPQAQVALPAAARFLVQFTISEDTHELLRQAQNLLSHAVPSGDVGAVFHRALAVLVKDLERRKCGAPNGRRESRRKRATTRRIGEGPGRYVPAHVRRAVWERDQGQCTFVSASGTRCKAGRFLEFDHIDPVARGGRATVEGMRLRCRAHNQYEAERAFGTDFMRQKRREARLARAEARAWAAKGEAKARAAEEAKAQAETRELTQDVLAGLRGLGCRAVEARRAADFSETIQGGTLEERMRAALKFLSRTVTQT